MSKREEKATRKRKLTAAEKKEIRAIMERARGDGKPHTAQDTLPFRQMYPDGLCKLDDNTWSKCIEFEDVNYQLAQPDQQTAIFEGLCDLYNSHDSSIGMEISLPCRHMNQEDFLKRIEIAAQGDAFDGIRQLYTQMLRRQLEKGNNGIVKTKLLVLTITESDIRAARARFARIILDALNHFKVMGALAKVLDGREWLELLHGILHPDGERFSFDWDWLAPSGLHVKDFIAPSAFRFASARQFQMGTKFCAASFLQITAPEMDDRILAELFYLNLPRNGGVKIVGCVRSQLGPYEHSLDHLPQDHFQRLTVLFVHCQQEEGQHHQDHAEGGRAGSHPVFEQKEKRYSYKYRRSKANELPPGQAEQHLGFYFGQVFWDGYISHIYLLNGPRIVTLTDCRS